MVNKNVLLKVVILGDGAVGKSCLLQRYVNNQYNGSSVHTIGVEFLNKEIYFNDRTFILQIWDTAGQERFRCLRTPFYRGSDLCLLVFSVGDRQSLYNLLRWKKEFIYYADISNPSDYPFVVLGNKTDLKEEEREVSTEEGLKWCKENGDLPYIETSAKESTKVEEAFIMALALWEVSESKQEKIKASEINTIILTEICEEPPPKSKSCC